MSHVWSLDLVAVKQFELRQKELTLKPASGHVRCKTMALGICGTDKGSFFEKHLMFKNGAGGGYGKPIGHEWSGKIIEAAKDVNLERLSLKLGDTVTVYPFKCFCGGECPQCQAGNLHKGLMNQTLGVQRPGAATEYFDVPVEDLMSTTLVPDVAVLNEPLSIGMSVASSLMNIVIIGGGSIGLACAWAAGVLGWKKDQILVMTRYPLQTKLAQKHIGVNAIEFPNDATIEDQIKEVKANDRIGKYGSHFVIESTGTDSGFIAAQRIVAAGGTIATVGFPQESTFYQGDFVRITANLVSSRNASRATMRRVLREMERTTADLKALITNRLTPSDFAVQANYLFSGNNRHQQSKIVVTDSLMDA
jgi:threonine dehydrogenase-like Zn-dependent dehydrogenase